MDVFEMSVLLYFWGFFGRKQIFLLLLESLEKELELLGTRMKAVGVWVRLLRELLIRAWRCLEASLSIALFTLITLGHFELRRGLVLSCWE